MWSGDRARVLVTAAAAFVVGAPAFGAEDLAALNVQGQRGQSADQTRRDRYECHNWAVAQSGQTPIAVPANNEQSSQAKASQRAERIDRALHGAAMGAGLGGFVRAVQHEDPGEGMLAGAAVGAVIGAATAGRSPGSEAAEPEGPSDYLRALTACLTGRGYTVAMPTPTSAPLTASR